jgi:NADH-quinone oxidoreductase subunit N
MTIDFSGINLNIESILPELIVALFAIITILVDLFTKGRRDKSPLLAGVSITGYVIAFIVCILYFNNIIGSSIFNTQSFNNMIVTDNLGLFFRMLSLGTGIVGTLLSIQYVRDRGMAIGEYYSVLMLATCGMMFTSASTDLTTLFVGIELMSIAVYILTGFARGDQLSNEASLKYFLLGIFSTAILVYGMAWLYGNTGYTNLRLIGEKVAEIVSTGGGLANNGGLLLAMVLLIAGFGFKIAAVPFHMWTPDAYQGAPTPFTAFMSVGPKAAGFVGLIRILTEALGPASDQWVPIVIILSVLTMTLGNLTALWQRSVKRMLGYSSIAHTGYILIGLAAFSSTNSERAISSMLFYLFSYLFMNMGAFGVIVWLQRNRMTDSLDNFRGLSSWAPGPAALMMLFMLSLTGIPPTIGFLGKYYVFVAALQSNLVWLVVIAALNSGVAAFYYLRVIWYMYFEEARGERTARSAPTLVYTLVGAAIAVVIFFFASWPIIDYARASMPAITALISGGK